MAAGKIVEFKEGYSKYLLGLLLVLLLSWLGLNLAGDFNLTRLIQGWQLMDLPLVIGACLLTASLWLIETLRMQVLLRLAGTRLSFFKVLQVNLAFAFAGAVTPAGMGATPALVYFFFRQGVKLEAAMAVATARMLLSMLFFAIVNPLVLFLLRKELGLSPLVVKLTLTGVISVSLLGLGFIFMSLQIQRIAFLLKPLLPERWGQPFYDTAVSFRNAWSRLLVAREPLALIALSLLTMLYWAGFFTIGWLLALDLGATISWTVMVGRQMILYFLLSCLPLPGGSGIAEMGYRALFAHAVVPGYAGILVAWWRFLTFYINLIIGGLVFWRLVKT
ncbi:Lysylphosphatidylglycerol synthase TM region [Neomoorella glycerini]|uniref:Phosphatidylglycerol lysyltransferase n=1 Tax=Neomoorella glycerini TaxID=55779 RepID=A0A6I5ZU91_9FIRM|nr:lysylphosphatidylglycerol synthase transmembrane domain-containing protein [Moorella glycerini]QGP93195.1 Lysylphosphatidylglycerol synthase TM region [Moorella glycerini]